MKIKSPPGLHYPITVNKFVKQKDEEVQRSSPLFKYHYTSVVEEGDKYGDVKTVQRTFIATFHSSIDGTITKWFIKDGAEIQRPGVDLVEIEEPCTHEVQFGGLCVNCGKDMTATDYLTEERNDTRATINMTHDNVALLVSQKEAARAEEDAKRRLLSAKKLSLIVDLDQTVIHTTCERTIAEWQADPENPNYEAVKDVKSFQLADDNVAHVAANWYYVKMRPGLKDFFDRMSTMYEMHIYTMATRAYAQAVAKIIDPERKYFGDRILSRDENYTDKQKSLHRLFPTNTDMAVIIDDRADIWHYSDNLVRVPVFNFFPGAGDINASFLPKQQELVSATPKKAVAEPSAKDEEGDTAKPVSVAGKPTESVPTDTTNGGLTEIEQQLLSMGAADAPEVIEQQAKEQEKVIITQQTERPLLKQQLLLDKEDEAAGEEETTEVAQNGDSQEHHKHRHSLLHDDDQGLEVIEANLVRVHHAFYDEYSKKKTGAQGGRVAALRGEKSPKKRAIEDFVPDVKNLMPQIKHDVLNGCVILFSGIIPLGMDVRQSDFGLWISSFGAEVIERVDHKRLTHVIANPDRKTSKVKDAAKNPRIKIVTAEWMFQCCTQWERVDETPYHIEVSDAERGGSPWEFSEEDIAITGDEEGEDTTTEAARLEMSNMSDDKWQALGDEIDDFLNESDESDDDNNSGSETDDSDASQNSTSKLQRRKKRTLERVTSLTNVVTADKSSGLPSPETTGPEEEQGEEEGKVIDPAAAAHDVDSDSNDGLEAQMLAEFERSASEDQPVEVA
ncbi:RNA polymerase II subunit A C-terminal domain phosphatase [Lophiotrema nucula]|uniref:RNA polymerase II subunit A C-terminal domain phosphatase n=1 Tax=Lophiotrema nucula TaxID=690887 RepID=A0A6A5ZAN8_9PLEO|nr:RNA polymerase II subunit A C-terminal domain phosphatase [Lophiotrema nucula]